MLSYQLYNHWIISLLLTSIHVLQQRISGIVKRILYDLFQLPAETSVNYIHVSSMGNAPFDRQMSVRRAALPNVPEELIGAGPGQSYVGRSGRAALKPELAMVDFHCPLEIPVFQHPYRRYADLADMLPHGTVAPCQHQRLLDQSSRCPF
jgi:hypothetical protein